MSTAASASAQEAAPLVGSALLRRPALTALLFAAWLSCAYFVLGPSSYVRVIDNADGVLPAHLAFRNAPSGWWAQPWAGGVDRLSQGMALDGSVLLFLVFPGWAAYAMVMLVQRFIATYFTFRLLRDRLQCEPIVALAGGAAYGLFSQSAVNFSWAGFTLYDGLALPALPLLLWWFAGLPRRRWTSELAAAFGLGIALAFSGGFFATLLFPVLVFWFVAIDRRKELRFWSALAGFAAGWTAPMIPFLMAAGQHAAASHRAHWNFIAGLNAGLAPRLRVLAVGLKDNAIPAVLIVAALWRVRGRERRLRWLALTAAFCLGFGTLYYLAARAIPALATLTHGANLDRWYLLAPFFLIVGGAYAIRPLMEGASLPGIRGRTWPLATIAGAVALVLLAIQSLVVNARMLNLAVAGDNFAALFRNPEIRELAAATRNEPPFRVATVAADAHAGTPWHPAYAWAYGFDTADGYVNLYPRRYQELWHQLIGPLLRDNPLRQAYFDEWGNRIYLFPPDAGFPAHQAIKVDSYYRLNLLSLLNVEYLISPVPLSDAALQLLPAGMRDEQRAWQASPRLHRLVEMIRGRNPGIPLYIYRNAQVLPRFSLATTVRAFSDRDALLAAMAETPASELHRIAFVEDGVGLIAAEARDGGTVEIASLSPDRIELRVSSNAAGVLVAAQNYDPNWQAMVDGAPAAVYPLDGALLGLTVAAGTHTVELRYEPSYEFRRR